MDMIDAYTMNQVIERNADLVKQRAELLEALKGMVEVFGNQEHVLTLWEVIDAKAAITKAEAAE